MTSEGAQSAVTTSAVVVAIVYAYRRLVEGQGASAPQLASRGAVKQLAGRGGPPPLEHFLVGYGFAFIVLALVAQAAPDLGGGMAVLVAVATVLAQGQAIAADINGQLTGSLASSGKAGKAGAQSADPGVAGVLPGMQNPVTNAGNAIGGALGSPAGFDPGFSVAGIGSALPFQTPIYQLPPSKNPIVQGDRSVGSATTSSGLVPGFLT